MQGDAEMALGFQHFKLRNPHYSGSYGPAEIVVVPWAQSTTVPAMF